MKCILFILQPVSHTFSHIFPLSLPCMGRGCDSACSSPPSTSSPKGCGRCVRTGSTQSQWTRGPGRAPRTLPFGSWTWLVWSGSPSPEGSPCAHGSEPQCPLRGERHPPEERKMNETQWQTHKIKMTDYILKSWRTDRHTGQKTINPSLIHLLIYPCLHNSSIQSTLVSFHPPTH